MELDLAGRKAVVAGGSRGIGRAIALAFVGAGAQVSICARGAAALEAARAELSRAGRAVHAAACDLADAGAVGRYVAEAANALGGIDILVNNASGFGIGDDEAAWSAGIAVDVMSMVRASHAAIPHLERSSGASILHIASISGLRPAARNPAYGAVKAAMIHYAATQAAMLARRGIRVNCISPGSIEFPGGVWEERRLAADPLYDRVRRDIPFGRLGTPQEVASVALFLSSEAARWVTGQNIVVDGGQLLGA
ncbi:MAG TPA: SDR family oxidoreductase [Burkholderiaceae bacterium]|nr:SDR family oxidoreductase [Burkholderiaceae bacterium]